MRLTSVVLCYIALFSLAACSTPSGPESLPDDPSSPSDMATAPSTGPSANPARSEGIQPTKDQRPRGPQESGIEERQEPGWPAAGSYVYSLSGISRSPLEATPRRYTKDARLHVKIDRNGKELIVESRSNEDDSTQTLHLRWENRSVKLTYLENEIASAPSMKCAIVPPIETIRFPLAVGSYETQSFESERCKGSARIRVAGDEAISDADGRTWTAWRIESQTTYRYGSSIRGKATGTTWFAPRLGTAVKSDVLNEGTWSSQPFSSHQVTLLARTPSDGN